MMRVFMVMLCSLMAVCSVSARISRREGMDGQAAIYRLPLFERAVCCTKYFEGWHSEKHHPYVGWGHKILPDERYSARTMTKRQADVLLRKDLRKFCAMFRQFGKDSLFFLLIVLIPAADTLRVIQRPSSSDQKRLFFRLGLNLRLVLWCEWETLFHRRP